MKNDLDAIRVKTLPVRDNDFQHMLNLRELQHQDVPNLITEIEELRTRNKRLEAYLLGIRNPALPRDHSLAVLLGYEAGLKVAGERKSQQERNEK